MSRSTRASPRVSPGRALDHALDAARRAWTPRRWSTSRSRPDPRVRTMSCTARRCWSSPTATTPPACGCKTASSRPARSTTTASPPPQPTPRPSARFRTARPADSPRARCGSRSSPARSSSPGFYTRARRPSPQQDVDLVVCLGDYIYEQAFADQTSRNAHRARGRRRCGRRGPDAGRSTARKYSLYHTDQRLVEVRRQFPLMAIWDDHEVEDNYAADKPGGAADRSAASRSRERRGNGYQRVLRAHAARRRRATSARTARSRSAHAELFLLDTRQLPRRPAVQPDRRVVSHAVPAPRPTSPGRTLLGAAQKAWLKGALAASQARLEARRQPGDDHVARRRARATRSTPTRGTATAPTARELVDFIGAARRHDVAFVTGDIHTYFTGTRDAHRAAYAGSNACGRPSSSPAPSRRRGSPTGKRRARPSGSPRPRRSTPRCARTTRRSSTPTRRTRATGWSRRGAICACSYRAVRDAAAADVGRVHAARLPSRVRTTNRD